jgi:hypothetical protein
MSAIQLEAAGGRAGGAEATARGAADWLRFAAAPTFAVMALLAAASGGGMPDMLCSAAAWSPLSGMVPMYLLMSVFHLGPWLMLISRRVAGRPGTNCERWRASNGCR